MVQVATRDAHRMPEGLKAFCARLDPESGTATVHLPEEQGARTLANLRDNGAIAVTFCKPSTYRTVQVKGRVLEIRSPTPEDDAHRPHFHEGMARELAHAGFNLSMARRIGHAPYVCVTFTVEQLFDQTPGPNAGRPLGA